MNARGQRRLLVLRTAAADLLADEGFDALTHRALSARSGVPLASTTHYFRTVDDLAVAAAEELAERWLAHARGVVAGLPQRRTSATAAARVLAELVLGPSPTPAALAAFYERYVQAGRVPELRTLVVAWNDELRGLVATASSRCGRPVTPLRAHLLLAALDGLVLTAVAEGAADPVEAAVRPLARLLGESAVSR